MANLGYNPVFTNVPSEAQSNPSAQERLEIIELIQKEIQSSMLIAQEKQKEYYNRHHAQEPEYHVGEKVWLSAENINTDRPSVKLASKQLGPYDIESKVSTHAYRLKLPRTMKIHPVFHISLLSRYRADTIPGRIQEVPPPVIVEDAEEWEVAKVLDSRYHRGNLQYKVEWRRFDEQDETWEPYTNLENSQELVDEYHLRFPDAAGPAPTPPRQLPAPPRPRTTRNSRRS